MQNVSVATTPRTARLRLGCSGWSYAHWRQPVYHGRPAGEWLPLYSELFDSVEVNATFYRLPSERMVSGWAEHSPPGFLFAVKMSRYATHIKRLDGAGQRCARLLDRLGPLIEAGKL